MDSKELLKTIEELLKNITQPGDFKIDTTCKNTNTGFKIEIIVDDLKKNKTDREFEL